MALLILTALVTPMASTAQTPSNRLMQQRAAFLKAEVSIAKAPWKDFTRITKGLEDYPLYPYLQQRALRNNLRRVPAAVVADFLDHHPQLPIAFQLRRAWLRQLYRAQKWQLFNRYYQTSGGLADACQHIRALYRAGQARKAWQRLRRLWLHGHSLPASCDEPLSLWRQAGQLNTDLAWQRAVLAVRAGNRSLVRYLRQFTTKTDRALLNLWLRAQKNPGLALAILSSSISTRDRRELLASAILTRLAGKDLDGAMELWQKIDSGYSLSPPRRNRIQQAIAIRLARKHRNEAPKWLASPLISDPTDSLYHWRLAASLWHQDWNNILYLYTHLPERLRQQGKWRYWRARAMLAQSDSSSNGALHALSQERSYYGFRAADVAVLPYQLGHQSAPADEIELQKLSRRSDIQRCRELLALGRATDARREWRWMLTRIAQAQRIVAAQLAERWNWHSMAIATLAKGPERNDLVLRFPLAYQQQIMHAARQSGLSPARIYAVIRQESAFMATAQSAAGARGLMQLLPITARHVARSLRLAYSGRRSLLNPAANLRLGSAYLKQLQIRFGEHPVLASAAYNAGPSRVRRWLPQQGAMASDVWIENVPFGETREYIRRLLTYQLIYTRRLNEDSIRMSAWMPEVPAAQ